MPRDLQYEQREIADALNHERQIERTPLAERKEGQKDFLEAIRRYPEIVAERVGWLLDGQYGLGAMLLAHNMTSRSNRPAAYCQMIAVLDHNCPRNMAVAAWKKLTKPQQHKLLSLVEGEIEEYEARQRDQ